MCHYRSVAFKGRFSICVHARTLGEDSNKAVRESAVDIACLELAASISWWAIQQNRCSSGLRIFFGYGGRKIFVAAMND